MLLLLTTARASRIVPTIHDFYSRCHLAAVLRHRALCRSEPKRLSIEIIGVKQQRLYTKYLTDYSLIILALLYIHFHSQLSTRNHL